MSDSVDDVLAHYGVRGMRWGVRRRRSLGKSSGDPTPVTLRLEPGKRVRATGGSGRSPSADAKAAVAYRQIAKSSSIDALTNKQLQSVVTRMNLEQQYTKAAANYSNKSAGRKFFEKFAKSEFTRIKSGKDPEVLQAAKIVSALLSTGGSHAAPSYTSRHRKK